MADSRFLRRLPSERGSVESRASLDHLRIFAAGSANRVAQPRRAAKPLSSQRRLSGRGAASHLRRVAVVLAGMALLVILRSAIA